MSKRTLSCASEEIAKLVGIAPPVLPTVLRGGTRLTGRWVNDPYEGYVGAMGQHVVAATFGGSGEATATIDGKRIVAPTLPGTITLAPRGHEGHWRISGRISVSNIYLSHDRLVGCADRLAEGRAFELLDRVNHHDARLFAIMKLICDEIEQPEHHSLVFLEHALDLMCFQLLRSHSTLANPALQPQKGLAQWQVRRVLAYMREHIGADVALQDLADVVGMSRFHFCSAFRAATGSPPHEYLARMRIKAACELLRGGHLPIKHVALAVGYGTPSAFSAAFHKAMGMTPRQFRREA
ncbi:helix-turn-helix domain-containing protein [Luteimonas sp. R10]|uniref:helix-turn-helix domain-containing protein n=1 Tax=Luteimonas sp. R10 TaxID=3108176 RepID=UPI00308ADF15|nr:AraC family transcriptional regulator [Luteimonas sp. R10]